MPKKRFTTLKQLWSLLTPYWKHEKKVEAWTLSAIALSLLLIYSANNAFKTFIPKWLVNALAAHDSKLFYHMLLLGVIMLSISVPIETFNRYLFDKLGVSWRRWFNTDLLVRYLQNKAYYNMGLYANIDNPDQRLAEDLNDFTQSSIELFAKIGTSIFILVAFTGILWTISPWLVLCVALYATVGNVVIVLLMRVLVKVNFLNIRYQADYRYNLVHVRDNVESIAFYKGENNEGSLLKRSFNILIENYFRLIKTKRNIMFASKAYVLLSVVFPYLILAPSILSGQRPVGSLVQAIEVFAVILTDLSLIIEQFPELSTYAAKVQRLANFVLGLKAKPPETAPLITCAENGEFNFKHVTVETPDLSRTLVKDLDLIVARGERLIIRGPSGCGKSSLLRAIAGLWNTGQGEIITPNMLDIMFLPQRPYMLIGSLREQLIYPNLASHISDDALMQALTEVNLAELPDRVGGFDTVLKWADVLSIGEQQRVMFVRLFLNSPKYAILDESTSALDEDNEAVVYSKLRQSNTTYLSVGHRSSLLKFHDHELLLDLKHGWKVLPINPSCNL